MCTFNQPRARDRMLGSKPTTITRLERASGPTSPEERGKGAIALQNARKWWVLIGQEPLAPPPGSHHGVKGERSQQSAGPGVLLLLLLSGPTIIIIGAKILPVNALIIHY